MVRFAPALLAATSALALGLAACDDRGRVDAPEPEPLAELSAPISELPYAEPAPVSRVAPDRGYQWAERAYGMQRAFYDVPPDYGFEYGDVEPLVWVSDDDWSLYAEPWDDGYRYYYYEPGAAYPYFVLDDEYGYGFDPTGVLIAVFDLGGHYVSQDVFYRVAPLAGRYYVHGRDLRNAAVQSRRIRVDQRVWADVGPRVNRGADPWLRAARDDKTWRQWRQRDGDRELRRFEGEQRRREDLRRVAAAQPPAPAPGIPGVRQDRRAEQFARRDARQQQAQAQQIQRQAALAEQQRGRAAAQADRRQAVAQAQAERGRQAQAERGRQAQAERGRQAQMERQQAQAERQQRAQAERQQQAQAERGRQAQVERQQAQAERQQRAQAQAERQQQAQAERQQQAQAERGRQAQAERQQVRAQAQAEREQARAAEQQGRVAAAREQAQAQRAQAAQQQRAAQAQARPQARGQAPNDNRRGKKDRDGE